jgi:hypothetical protein
MIHYAAGVGERLKAPSAVVLAHARIADAAERELRDHRMDRAIVDRRIARFRAVENALCDADVLSEDVEAERAGPAVDPLNHGLHRINLQDRQDRAEDLVLHYRRVQRHVDEHCRRNVTFGDVGLTADRDFPALQQADKPVEVLAVDNAAIIWTDFWIVAVKVADRLGERLHEGVLNLGHTST